MRQLAFLFAFLIPILLSAQPFQVSGTIINGEDDKTIEGASIFINNASGGTVSGKDGQFFLSNISFNKFELVVSHVSFETLVVPITPENIGRRFKIQLAPKQAELQNVVVAPIEKNGWERWGRLFTQSFIGTSDLAAHCTFKNPQVLRFRYNKNTGVLKVTASDKLIIENKKLGYTIHYQLEEFMYSSKEGMTSYTGYTSFIPMDARRDRKMENWRKERLEAYSGSVMHFMRSAYKNTLAEEGYELRTLRRIYKKDTATRALYDALLQGKVDAVDTSRYVVQLMKSNSGLGAPIIYIFGKNGLPCDSIRWKDSTGNVFLFFGNELQVRYKNELEKSEYAQQKSGGMLKPQKQHSIIFFVERKPILVEANGLYFNPLSIFMEEYWAWEKIAEMLPADYQPGD